MGYAMFCVQLHNVPQDLDKLTADIKALLIAQPFVRSDSDVDIEVIEHTQNLTCEECARNGDSPHNQTGD